MEKALRRSPPRTGNPPISRHIRPAGKELCPSPVKSGSCPVTSAVGTAPGSRLDEYCADLADSSRDSPRRDYSIRHNTLDDPEPPTGSRARRRCPVAERSHIQLLRTGSPRVRHQATVRMPQSLILGLGKRGVAAKVQQDTGEVCEMTRHVRCRGRMTHPRLPLDQHCSRFSDDCHLIR